MKRFHCTRCGGSVEYDVIAEWIDTLDDDELEALGNACTRLSGARREEYLDSEEVD